jgi:hypothetical protein
VKTNFAQQSYVGTKKSAWMHRNQLALDDYHRLREPAKALLATHTMG